MRMKVIRHVLRLLAWLGAYDIRGKTELYEKEPGNGWRTYGTTGVIHYTFSLKR